MLDTPKCGKAMESLKEEPTLAHSEKDPKKLDSDKAT